MRTQTDELKSTKAPLLIQFPDQDSVAGKQNRLKYVPPGGKGGIGGKFAKDPAGSLVAVDGWAEMGTICFPSNYDFNYKEFVINGVPLRDPSTWGAPILEKFDYAKSLFASPEKTRAVPVPAFVHSAMSSSSMEMSPVLITPEKRSRLLLSSCDTTPETHSSAVTSDVEEDEDDEDTRHANLVPDVTPTTKNKKSAKKRRLQKSKIAQEFLMCKQDDVVFEDNITPEDNVTTVFEDDNDTGVLKKDSTIKTKKPPTRRI